jgi:hypothetical protein
MKSNYSSGTPATDYPPPPMLPDADVNVQKKEVAFSPPPLENRDVKVVQAVSKPTYDQIKRMMQSIFTFRTVVNKPESGAHLRRIQNLGRICSELMQLAPQFPHSRFSPSHSDKVIRDRSYEAVEYRHFGDFDQRLNGWIKPINTAVYIDLVFDGKGRRRNHIRGQVTRNGTLEGHFYSYSWDKYGQNWKFQGKFKNVLCHDNGLPYTGEILIYGADPTGAVKSLEIKFPVKVTGIIEPSRKEIRHREGKPVSIGNKRSGYR